MTCPDLVVLPAAGKGSLQTTMLMSGQLFCIPCSLLSQSCCACWLLLSVVGLCRAQAEMEARLIEEETERMVSEKVEARVQEVMASQAVQQSLQERLVRERKLLEEQV